jgi:DMSO/TMAO reductase YedYZ molybdopterin-dependent catalytic subunit
MDWLGKATVLGLSGNWWMGCGGSQSSDFLSDAELMGDAATNGLHSDASPRQDAGHPAEIGPPATDGGPWSFQPGPRSHPVYAEWGERTVDRQDLMEILSSWRLSVGGLVVGDERELSFEHLMELTRLRLTMDFHCVEGWSVYDVPWTGVHLSTLLELVGGAQPEATHVTFHTIGGRYNESLPLSVALEPHTLLAYGVADSTLPLPHGFPLRLVVPRLLAYKSAKYVERIELTDRPVEGYWVQAGYSYEGLVPEGRLRPGRF